MIRKQPVITRYGGERKMAPFFSDMVMLVFEPMPQEFIYHAILKPIFDNTQLQHQSRLFLVKY